LAFRRLLTSSWGAKPRPVQNAFIESFDGRLRDVSTGSDGRLARIPGLVAQRGRENRFEHATVFSAGKLKHENVVDVVMRCLGFAAG
jgi:hypothetical protein